MTKTKMLLLKKDRPADLRLMLKKTWTPDFPVQVMKILSDVKKRVVTQL